jgi:hypothetical protein
MLGLEEVDLYPGHGTQWVMSQVRHEVRRIGGLDPEPIQGWIRTER